jgi:5-methylthioadenosine/S-adenosylhomocysteine deaminase
VATTPGGSARPIDGEVILEHGKLTRVDEDKLIDEIAAVHARLEPLITESENDVERLRPAYERIYRRCQAIDIAPETYPARFDR